MRDLAAPGPRLIGGATRLRSGVRQLHLFPQSLDGILDLLVRHARPVVVVTNAWFYRWDGREHVQETIAELARALGIACHSQGPRANPEITAIDREDLPVLLDGIYQWNVVCWDALRPPTTSALREQRVLMKHAGPSTRATPALRELDGAGLYVASHDNDSLLVEAREPAFTRAVFGRALQSLVATTDATGAGRYSYRRADVPVALIEEVWATAPEFELRAAQPSGPSGRVRIAFGERAPDPIGWSKDFQPLGYLDYEALTGTWTLRHQRA